ncbi:RING-H2 finger protein ATL74-like [Phalaenopsis equestris]|uniref:RING-H2 finger protein ATL74-like n=1 Tax=Phalaenopsis equestris TaxID=78828 RepID=UPI0009E1BC36|nr:RING-H2 finger protein ATL74-like [Phalaenopsis equestris]
MRDCGGPTSSRFPSPSTPIPVYAVETPGGEGSSPPPLAALGCPICLSDFTDGQKIRILPACDHRYHVSCIDTWLLLHGSCPTCRHRLSPPGKQLSPEIV